jgi:ribose transport system substrate-binding protein
MISTKKLAMSSAAVLIALTAVSCSKSPGTTTAAATPAGAITLQGSVSFNQASLAKLDAALKSALTGKDLSGVNIAMVVNVAADYWKAGQVGFLKGCSDLGLASS